METGSPLRKDGFRERGQQVTRLEAFVDAAFAFAVTLLVIRVGTVPTSIPDLYDALRAVPAFAASFAIVAMFWMAHNTWSRRYGLDDGAPVFFSLLLVFLVLVYVYPLRMLFGSGFGWATQALPDAFRLNPGFRLDSLRSVQQMYVIYAIAWSTLGLVIVQLYRIAWKRRAELELSLDEQAATRAEIARWLMVPATGFVSLVLALALPFGENRVGAALAGLPGVVYSLMGFTGLVMAAYERRERARLVAEGVPATAPARGTSLGAKRRRRRRNRPPA
jgi:uncharacterized membrane protein